jgi:hypothetical protein
MRKEKSCERKKVRKEKRKMRKEKRKMRKENICEGKNNMLWKLRKSEINGKEWKKEKHKEEKGK